MYVRRMLPADPRSGAREGSLDAAFPRTHLHGVEEVSVSTIALGTSLIQGAAERRTLWASTALPCQTGAPHLTKYFVPRFLPCVLSFFEASSIATGRFKTAVSVLSAFPISSRR
jgi:hypothetical protein